MSKDRFWGIWKGGNGRSADRAPTPLNGARGEPLVEEPASRQSPGLDQFFGALRDTMGLSLLDLGGASQANVSYITNLGHRIYSEDALRALESTFGGGDFYGNQSDPGRIDEFIRQALSFPDNHFDGALVWDSLQFMSPTLLQPTLRQLRRILRPNAYLLTFFHADERATSVPVYSYRIADSRTLHLARRSEREPAQFFNNRALERLFQDFQSVKLFLTRDSLREVIVKR